MHYLTTAASTLTFDIGGAAAALMRPGANWITGQRVEVAVASDENGGGVGGVGGRQRV